MNRRYAILIAGIAAAAVLLSLLGRLPRQAAAPAAPAASAPRTSLELTIDDGQVMPVHTQIDKDFEVDVAIVNRGDHAVRLTLSGYEDRVQASIDAGARHELHFLADRPGDGFAWLVDGKPAGRFVVAGSHLVEGHR